MIEFVINKVPDIVSIIQLYEDAQIIRPITDVQRIHAMFSNSNLVVSAWDNDKLIGIARSLTDYSYCCYMSDLAVAKSYQSRGIGKKLIAITKEEIGTHCMLLLLSAPSTMEYYPHIGMEKVDNGFIIQRSE